MHPKPKQTISTVVIILYILWDNFGSPIWNINVERWAERRDLDQTLNQVEAPSMPIWAIDWINFLTGDFLKGVVALAIVFLTYDVIRWVTPRIKALKNKRPDPKGLADQARLTAQVIDANSQFVGSEYFNAQWINLDTYEVVRKIAKYAEIKNSPYIFDMLMSERASLLTSLADILETEWTATEHKEAIHKVISELPEVRQPHNTATKRQS